MTTTHEKILAALTRPMTWQELKAASGISRPKLNSALADLNSWGKIWYVGRLPSRIEKCEWRKIAKWG